MGTAWNNYFGKFFFYQSLFWNPLYVEKIGQEVENLESVLNKFWSVENIEAKDISKNIFFITDKDVWQNYL